MSIHNTVLGFLASLAVGQALAHASIMADSVADWSGVQGAGGWHYGYVVPASDPGAFVPFEQFGDYLPTPVNGSVEAWFIEPLSSGGSNFFTNVSRYGGHPNSTITSGGRPEEHWAVRRWVSDHSGPVEVSGLFGDLTGDFGPSPSGVIGQIWLNGAIVWEEATNGFSPDSQYTVAISLLVGDVLDFVVKPGADDFSDTFTFTATIVPAPSLLFATIGTPCLWIRRRRTR